LVVFVAKRELLGKYYLRNTTSWGYTYKILPFKTPAFRSFISLSAGGATVAEEVLILMIVRKI
jgi:hypothetical protein